MQLYFGNERNFILNVSCIVDHPDTKTCRTLTLIAKCIMTLASHGTIEQNAKEPWMVRLNEFVQVLYHKYESLYNIELTFERIEQYNSFYELH